MRFKHLWLAAVAASLAIGPAQAQDLTGTLKKIKDTGTITIGHRDSSVPFSYLDDQQKPIGYALDICMKVVDAVKAELKMDKLDVKMSTRISLLADGIVDLECGSTTNNGAYDLSAIMGRRGGRSEGRAGTSRCVVGRGVVERPTREV
jgi:glutamate/aspartate transport system substrate-binding protein